jgi:hypothetical protein
MLPQSWPRWTLILIALALAGVAIGLGLLLQPIGVALAGKAPTPTPTLHAIAYALPAKSQTCRECHFSLDALKASAADPSKAEEFLIEPESIYKPHGKLGCVTCHGGDGTVSDKEASHKGLIADITKDRPADCIVCHYNLPAEIPGDRLRTPHKIVTDKIEHGQALDVYCSDCHGQVGHGFDPVSGNVVCNMTVCLDCHKQRNLDVKLTECNACHVGPHDVQNLNCELCHTSTQDWAQVKVAVHPMPLVGKHAEVACFSCHRYPNFGGLSTQCAACHEKAHDFGGDDCASCHDPANTWTFAAGTWPEHVQIWDQYKGKHTQVDCVGCHIDGLRAKIASNCDACHAKPSSHNQDAYAGDCVKCHQADQAWESATKPAGG